MSNHEYQRVFAALDGGKTQEDVAWKAVHAASSNRAELVFGHVVDSVPDALTGADVDDLTAAIKGRLEAALADVLEAARNDERIPSVRVEVKAGAIQDTLHNQLIKPFDPDLVICGERGLSNITYVFVGSVSTYLIRHLRCDVLVVKKD